ncbi:hypothetical protein PROFUN_02271 [Planoprotostelium fungivorum]|uniref:Fungal lipase-type domain-containing protein n=1 Tax=Planoprotostelium fungivorum TaxID=1890364 RepID=A0A2P6NYG0_9EUKA|nr:hypothetical protein PROFUN_02271 [Planoprotostelium fungivorum]
MLYNHRYRNTRILRRGPTEMRFLTFCIFSSLLVVVAQGIRPEILTSSSNDGFLLSSAKAALLVSYDSYCQPGPIAAWNCFWCQYRNDSFQSVPLSSVQLIQDPTGRTFGYIGVSDSIVLSFRGTVETDILNWVTDLSVESLSPFQNQILGAKVHGGFLHAYMSVQNQVRTALNKLTKLYPKKNVLFTGHSLGGALTLLAAVDSALDRSFNNSVTIYTMGSPRVGNLPFSTFVDSHFSRHYRLTNCRDPIPRIPPREMGFVHSGREYYSPNGDAQFKTCTYRSGSEDETCIDGLASWQINVNDHMTYFGLDKRIARPHGCR